MALAIPLLTFLVIILIVGVCASLLSRKIRVPDTLLLLLAGIFIGWVHRSIGSPVELPPVFLVAISLLALSVVVFTSSARLKLRELDSFSVRAVEIALLQVLLFMTILAGFGIWFFQLSIPQALLLASTLIGTSPAVMLTMLSKAKHRVLSLLKLESIVNSPLTVLIPFIIVDIVQGIHPGVTEALFAQSIPFLSKFVAGIGAGILIGIIMMKIARIWYSPLYSPIIMLCAALSTYTLAENVGGNGVLAVTALGVFLGHVQLREKEKVLAFESVLSKILYILVFVLFGTVIELRTEQWFLINVLLFYGIYLVLRYLSILIVTRKDYSFKEMMFMTFSCSKGIASATVAFSLLTLTVFDVRLILDVVIWFILISIVISAIIAYGARYFLGEDVCCD